MFDNSITNVFGLKSNGNQIVKLIKTDVWNTIKTSKPLKDDIITYIFKFNSIKYYQLLFVCSL